MNEIESLRETLKKYIDKYDAIKNKNKEILEVLKNIATGKIGKYSCAEEYARKILEQNQTELENEHSGKA